MKIVDMVTIPGKKLAVPQRRRRSGVVERQGCGAVAAAATVEESTEIQPILRSQAGSHRKIGWIWVETDRIGDDW